MIVRVFRLEFVLVYENCLLLPWDVMFIVLMTCLWDMSWIISRSVMNWASMTMLHRVPWFSNRLSSSLAPVFLLRHFVISGCLCMFSPSLGASSSRYKYGTHLDASLRKHRTNCAIVGWHSHANKTTPPKQEQRKSNQDQKEVISRRSIVL